MENVQNKDKTKVKNTVVFERFILLFFFFFLDFGRKVRKKQRKNYRELIQIKAKEFCTTTTATTETKTKN